MADVGKRLARLEDDAIEAELTRRMEREAEAMIDALERELSPLEFRKVLAILADLNRGRAS